MLFRLHNFHINHAAATAAASAAAAAAAAAAHSQVQVHEEWSQAAAEAVRWLLPLKVPTVSIAAGASPEMAAAELAREVRACIGLPRTSDIVEDAGMLLVCCPATPRIGLACPQLTWTPTTPSPRLTPHSCTPPTHHPAQSRC